MKWLIKVALEPYFMYKDLPSSHSFVFLELLEKQVQHLNMDYMLQFLNFCRVEIFFMPMISSITAS